MKKGLVGIVVLAIVAMVCVPTFAAVTHETVDWEATLDWTIFDETGIMPDASYTTADLIVVDLTLSTGNWSASTADAFIKYTAEMANIGLYAATDYDIYDFGMGIAEAQGVTLGAELAPMSLDAVYTRGSEYGVGGTYTADQLTVGAKYNSTGAYGVELVSPVGPITLTGQYGAGGALLGAVESGYLVKGSYALTGNGYTGDSAVTLQYKSTKAPLLVPTTTEISAELVDFPITGTTMLGATVTSTSGVSAVTVTGTTVTTLADGVTLTLDIASTAGTLTYSGVIGVSL